MEKFLPYIMPLVAILISNSIGCLSVNAQISQQIIKSLKTQQNTTQTTEAASSFQILAPNSTTKSTYSEYVADNSINQADTAEVTSPEQSNLQNTSDNAMAQVTSVSQLSDVQPTDWAFQALQSLVERYGVIAGYPDGTFRGNRALSRYEFAAGLNAALNRINELVAAGSADSVSKEDLVTLQKLQEDFAAELATLRGRVDTLEAQTAELAANQFSTTTRLNAELIYSLASLVAGDNANGEPVDRNPVLNYRIRLNLETSFTGEDQLTTRLQAGNIEPFGTTNSGETLTNEGRLEYDGDTDNDVILALLRYRFPLSPRTNVYLAGTGNGFVDLDASYQLNPYFDGGSVSLFGLRNPIYNYGAGAGAGLRHFFNEDLELNLGYLVSSATVGSPQPNAGLFNGNYAALAQVIFSASDYSKIGLTYINSYAPFSSTGDVDPSLAPELVPFGTSTGSNFANTNFGTPVITNAYGVSGTFRLSPHFALGGWVGYANQRYIGRGDGTVWNWAVTLAFPDIGKEGNLGGILVGMEPKLTEVDSNLGEPDEDTSLHIHAFYRYQLTDNIQITPGIIWLTAPDHDADNDDILIGVVRTVFRF